jgi:hypothetical protein
VAAQFGLVLVAAFSYFAVRGITEADVGVAVDHAQSVLTVERHLGLDIESALQAHLVGHHWMVTAVNWIYIWGHWPAIAAVMVWLHRRHHDGYLTMRNALFVSGAIGLVIFVLFPVAPPRLAGFGLVDTVTEHSSSYRVLQPPSLVNKYAAVPSLHVGWNFLVGVLLWRHAGRGPLRLLAVASPVLMFAAVVLTANHFVVDGVIGIAVAATGLAVADRRSRRIGSSLQGAGDVGPR